MLAQSLAVSIAYQARAICDLLWSVSPKVLRLSQQREPATKRRSVGSIMQAQEIWRAVSHAVGCIDLCPQPYLCSFCVLSTERNGRVSGKNSSPKPNASCIALDEDRFDVETVRVCRLDTQAVHFTAVGGMQLDLNRAEAVSGKRMPERLDEECSRKHRAVQPECGKYCSYREHPEYREPACSPPFRKGGEGLGYPAAHRFRSSDVRADYNAAKIISTTKGFGSSASEHWKPNPCRSAANQFLWVSARSRKSVSNRSTSSIVL